MAHSTQKGTQVPMRDPNQDHGQAGYEVLYGQGQMVNDEAGPQKTHWIAFVNENVTLMHSTRATTAAVQSRVRRVE